MIADKACWERGCACHDMWDTGVEVVEKREWVGLTAEDKWEIVLATERDDRSNVMKLVEDKLKERNT